MVNFHFKEYQALFHHLSDFETLFKLFQDLLLYTSGNVADALKWLTELDNKYNLTSDDYGIADFLEDLKKKGFIKEVAGNANNLNITSKLEIALRQKSLNDIFDQLKKAKRGNHHIKQIGLGDEITSETKPYQFGDKLDQIDFAESLKNAQINHGIGDFKLTQQDLLVKETFYQSQMSTALMIDISHSMILYGEDRITPAKKVAMALSELIITRYPKDTLDILVFGNDAWTIKLKDLPYLEVGPYHTNTVAGLELAIDLLRKRKNPNKQIFMITDGKPTCIKRGKKYYKNPWGLDKKILSRTLALAHKCRKLEIPITTFMIATDPYLVQFVDEFTKANNGKAYYSALDKLGEFIFMDYKKNKKKNR